MAMALIVLNGKLCCFPQGTSELISMQVQSNILYNRFFFNKVYMICHNNKYSQVLF